MTYTNQKFDTLALSDENFTEEKEIAHLFSGVITKDLNISNNKTMSKFTNASAMFYGGIFGNIDVTGLDLSNVVDMSLMFAKVSAPSLDLSSWNISKVRNFSWMFEDSTIGVIDLTGWTLKGPISHTYQMFRHCESDIITQCPIIKELAEECGCAVYQSYSHLATALCNMQF